MSRFRTEGPVKATPTLSAREKRSTADSTARRWERARTHYLIGKITGLLAPDAPISKKLAMVQGLVETGILPSVPSSNTVRSIAKQWSAGAQSIEDFLGAPRVGRPSAQIDERLHALLTECIRRRRPKSFRRVHGLLKAEAEKLGVPLPSRRSFDAIAAHLRGQLEQSAARHGQVAAEIDGLPHSTIPAMHTHDVWTVDEFTAPVWCKMYDRAQHDFVSYRPDVVIVQDYASRAVLAAWVADPSRRTGPGGTQKHGGTDINDLTAALLSAALPEVATPSCREFAGRLCATLRWDRARHHEALRAPLEKIGVTVPKLPGGRPVNRGVVERLIGTLKSRCDSIIGHVDHYLPVDRAAKEMQAEQDVIASTGGRQVTREVVPTEFLLTAQQLRTEVDRVVREYNDAEHSALEGHTPAEAFRALYPRVAPRSGRDLLALLSVRATTVTTSGVVHRVGETRRRFSYSVNGAMLGLGSKITYRADPLLRGLFAETPVGSAFLPPLAEWAAKQDPDAVARQQRGAAKLAVAEAKIAQREAAAQLVGEAVLRQGDAELIERLAATRDSESDEEIADGVFGDNSDANDPSNEDASAPHARPRRQKSGSATARTDDPMDQDIVRDFGTLIKVRADGPPADGIDLTTVEDAS